MLETLAYTPIAGAKTEPPITVFALSTCGFCKRAMRFLDEHDFAYRYIHIDKIPLETKTELKKELKEKYKADIAFPFAMVGDSDHLVGFIEVDWKRTLGI